MERYLNISRWLVLLLIVPTIQESLKQVTAKYNAEELSTKRDQVKSEID